jgi:hypothetical protein
MTRYLLDSRIGFVKVQSKLDESYVDDEGLIMSYLQNHLKRVRHIKDFLRKYSFRDAEPFIEDCE